MEGGPCLGFVHPGAAPGRGSARRWPREAPRCPCGDGCGSPGVFIPRSGLSRVRIQPRPWSAVCLRPVTRPVTSPVTTEGPSCVLTMSPCAQSCAQPRCRQHPPSPARIPQDAPSLSSLPSPSSSQPSPASPCPRGAAPSHRVAPDRGRIPQGHSLHLSGHPTQPGMAEGLWHSPVSVDSKCHIPTVALTCGLPPPPPTADPKLEQPLGLVGAREGSLVGRGNCLCVLGSGRGEPGESWGEREPGVRGSLESWGEKKPHPLRSLPTQAIL